MPLTTAPAGVTTLHAPDLSTYRAAVNDSFVPLHVTSTHADRFSGALRGAVADGIHVSEVRARAHTVERTPELIARGDRPAFKVSVMLAGTGLLIQDGREAVLRPGDMALYDTSRPYTLSFDEDLRTIVMMFPHDALPLPARSLGGMTAVRIPGDAGLGALTSPFLTRLGLGLEEVAGACGGRLTRAALDLLATVYTHELGLDDASAADPRLALLARIRAYIDEHLASPALTPGTIAAAHFISTRHLHSLFHAEGTTVSTVIRRRRLEACRRALRDPRDADVPVAVVGARWGFPDAAHFSRTFKAAFGVSPSEYRGGR
ncbi:AraC-like ligand-binding domain-containing protein [Microbacterium sp. GXF7504]